MCIRDSFYVQDLFHRIYLSDIEDRPFVAICPNPHNASYEAVAYMINKYNVNCRNFHAFAMDEWADEDGNVAPLTYGAGLGYSFVNHFYMQIREDLRPPFEQWHTFNNDNKADVYKRQGEKGDDSEPGGLFPGVW